MHYCSYSKLRHGLHGLTLLFYILHHSKNREIRVIRVIRAFFVLVFFVYGLCYLIKFPYLANLYQLALRNTSLTNTNLYYD